MPILESQSILVRSDQPLVYPAGWTYRFTKTAGDEAIVADRSDGGKTKATVLGDEPVELWAQDDVVLSAVTSAKVTVTRAEEGLSLDAESVKSEQQQDFEAKLNKSKK
jgi:hypothetical protein